VFSLYGVLHVVSIWFYTSFILPTLKELEPTTKAIAVLRQLSLGGFLWAILSTVLVLFTAVGMFQARRWSRSLGLFLAGVVPLGYLNRGLLFGAPAVFTWIPLAVFSMAMFVFWLLWKSQEVGQILGDISSKEKRALLIGVGCFGLISAGLFGAVLYVKAEYNPSRIKQMARLIYPRTQSLDKNFTLREALDLRIAVPVGAQIISLKRSEGEPLVIGLGTPNKDVTVSIRYESMGNLVASVGRPIGISSPYEIHRHVLGSEWNCIFLLMKAMVIPRFGENLQLRELESTHWRGLALSGRKDQTERVEYSIYSSTKPTQSVTCTWFVRNDAIALSAIEEAMGLFQFLDATPNYDSYVESSRELLAEGRFVDAQFLLAQAYLLGPKNLGVTTALARVSSKLDSWSVVGRLAKEWLREDPGSVEAKALEEKAAKALATNQSK